MAKLTALPSLDIIRGFKGVLDFYVRRGQPCVRKWPHTPRSRRSAGSIAAASLFGGILQSYRLVAPTVLEAYQDNAKGIPRTPRDVYVSAVLGHLHERTLPVPPPTAFTVWSPDAPPPSPSALDDEFADATFNTALWSEFDPGDLLAVSQNETGLILDGASQAGDDICGVYQAIPPVDFSITAKLGLLALRQDFAVLGLALWEDATDPATALYAWMLTYRAADQQLELTRWTNYTTWNSTPWNAADVHILTDLYFRIRRISTTYCFDWSSNGIGWRNCWTGSLAFTPAHFGIMINNVGTAATIRGVATFFRYTPYGTFNRILQGDRISADRTP